MKKLQSRRFKEKFPKHLKEIEPEAEIIGWEEEYSAQGEEHD